MVHDKIGQTTNCLTESTREAKKSKKLFSFFYPLCQAIAVMEQVYAVQAGLQKAKKFITIEKERGFPRHSLPGLVVKGFFNDFRLKC
jgi:hypothetical protein